MDELRPDVVQPLPLRRMVEEAADQVLKLLFRYGCPPVLDAATLSADLTG